MTNCHQKAVSIPLFELSHYLCTVTGRPTRHIFQKSCITEAQRRCCTIRAWLPGTETIGGGRQWSGGLDGSPLPGRGGYLRPSIIRSRYRHLLYHVQGRDRSCVWKGFPPGSLVLSSFLCDNFIRLASIHRNLWMLGGCPQSRALLKSSTPPANLPLKSGTCLG